MRRVQIDKIASITARLNIARHALLGDEVVAQAGYVIAVKVIDHKEVYDKLEDVSGRMVKLYPGDVVVGALGERRALHGHAGVVPAQVKVGDTLHMLNLGGVIGQCIDSHPSVGAAMRVEVLGSVLHFPVLDSRVGKPAHIRQGAIPEVERLNPQEIPPIVFITGTSMNAGKTRVAAEVVRVLSRAGYSVGASKLTGVALRSDILRMQDCGARRAYTFADAGYPSTSAQNSVAAARAIFKAMAAPGIDRPDVIIAEMGAGLLDEYGVLDILEAPDIAACAGVHVCCSIDPVGALGAAAIYRDRLTIQPAVFSGPVTDHMVGCKAIQNHLDMPAFNAITQPDKLGATLLDALRARVPTLAPKGAVVSPAGGDGD
jgi:hypothetical protein